MDRKRIKRLFEEAMEQGRIAELQGDYPAAFAQLERAHILGQRWLTLHMRSHWAMLRIARLTANRKEVRGQITRLIGVPPFWLFGWVPKGNTGGANVSPVQPMPYPAELAAELSGYKVWRDVAMRALLLGCGIAAFWLFKG